MTASRCLHPVFIEIKDQRWVEKLVSQIACASRVCRPSEAGHNTVNFESDDLELSRSTTSRGVCCIDLVLANTACSGRINSQFLVSIAPS